MIGDLRKRLGAAKQTMLAWLRTCSNPVFIFCYVWLAGRRNEYVSRSWSGRKLFDMLHHIKPVNSFKLTGTGVLLLFSDTSVIKIPLSRIADAALERNFHRYLMVRDSGLARYVPYCMEFGQGYYRMDRLWPVSDSAAAVAVVIEAFESFMPPVCMSAQMLREKCSGGVAVLQRFTEKNIEVPASAVIRICAMHGDLTEHNVMLDASGQVVLIDLERFDFNGIAGIDLIHFEVNRDSVEKRCSFTDCLPGFTKRGYDRDLLIVYLLYRLGAEHDDDVRLPDSYYRRACQAYESLLAKGD